MPDFIMVANPKEYESQKTVFDTKWLSKSEFFEAEELLRGHDSILWQAFHTHGKFLHAIEKADFFSVAVSPEGVYVGSAFVITVADVWLLEYVMTNPKAEGKGVGSAVMNCVMEEAKKAQATGVVLNCDYEFRDGMLPKFYEKFGFKRV